MESLSDILSGAAASDKSEAPVNTPEAKEPAKDEKPAEAEKPAASAPSAEQASAEVKAESKAGDKPTEESKTTESQPRDEKGKFVKPDDEETVVALRNALHAARRQKQEADRRATEAEQRAAEAAKPKDEKPKKDFWEDPEAALEERLSEREQRLKQEADTRYFNLCEAITKREFKDYAEIVGELMEETEADPALAKQVFAAARAAADAGGNPAEYLYTTAKNRREMKAVGGDLGKFKEHLAEPFKATIAEKDKAIAEKDQKLADQDKQIKSLQAQLDKLGKVPASLNKEPSASRAAVDVESAEPLPLSAIVEPKKRRA